MHTWGPNTPQIWLPSTSQPVPSFRCLLASSCGFKVIVQVCCIPGMLRSCHSGIVLSLELESGLQTTPRSWSATYTQRVASTQAVGPEAGSLQHPWLSLVNQVGGPGLASEPTANGARSQEPGAEKQLAYMNPELALPVQWESSHSQGRNSGRNTLYFQCPSWSTCLSAIQTFDTLYKGFQSDPTSFQRQKECDGREGSSCLMTVATSPSLARGQAPCLLIEFRTFMKGGRGH